VPAYFHFHIFSSLVIHCLFWPLVWRGDSFNKHWGMQSTSKGRWPFCSYQLHIGIHKVLLICNAGVFLSLLPNNTKATATSPVTSQLLWAHTTYPSWQTNYTTSNPIFAEAPSWHENERDCRARARLKQKKTGINDFGSKSTIDMVQQHFWFRVYHNKCSGWFLVWQEEYMTDQSTRLSIPKQSLGAPGQLLLLSVINWVSKSKHWALPNSLTAGICTLSSCTVVKCFCPFNRTFDLIGRGLQE